MSDGVGRRRKDASFRLLVRAAAGAALAAALGAAGAEAQEYLPADHKPQVCIVSEAESADAPWGPAESCLPGSAIYGISRPSMSHNSLEATCCRLPAEDILLESGYYRDQCPDDAVVTGSIRQCSEAQSLQLQLVDQERHCPRLVRCSRINSRRYQLAAARPAVYWGSGSSYWQNAVRYTRLDIPAAIRFALARESKYQWDGQGCIGDPFGSLLARGGGKSCGTNLFRRLEYRGLPGDPPAGTPVVMFPACDYVSDVFNRDSACLPNPDAADTAAVRNTETRKGQTENAAKAPANAPAALPAPAEVPGKFAAVRAYIKDFMSAQPAAPVTDLAVLTAARDAARAEDNDKKAAELNERIAGTERLLQHLTAIERNPGITPQARAEVFAAVETGILHPAVVFHAALALAAYADEIDIEVVRRLQQIPSPPTEKFEQLLNAFQSSAVRHGRHDQASWAYGQARALGLDSVNTHLTEAWNLLRSGRTAAGEALFRELFAQRPNDPAVLANFANGLIFLERCREGHELLERAIRLNPLSVQFLLMVGYCYETNGHPEKSEELIARYLEIGTFEYTSHLSLYERRLRQGDHAAADLVEAQIIASWPEREAESREKLRAAALANGQCERAKKHQPAGALEPAFLKQLGHCHLNAQRPAEAIEYLGPLLTAGNADAETHFLAALAEESRQNYRAALTVANRAVELENSGDLNPYHLLVRLCRIEKCPGGALAASELALRKYPQNAEAVAIWAKELAISGEDRKADDAFRRLEAIGTQTALTLSLLAVRAAEVGDLAKALGFAERLANDFDEPSQLSAAIDAIAAKLTPGSKKRQLPKFAEQLERLRRFLPTKVPLEAKKTKH